MSTDNQSASILFGVIPSILRKPEQVARWDEGGESLTYTLLREPLSLEEITEYDHCMAIWRENETLTYFIPRGSKNHSAFTAGRRYLSLSFGGAGPSMEIFGTTDDAVAETAAFFLGLEAPSQEDSLYLGICSYGRSYNFRAAGTDCLTHMFGIAPSREVEFTGIILSAEQCTVLATRNHPTHVTFWNCELEDGGTAFVNALEGRESSFGALDFQSTALNDDNLKRLLRVETIDHLGLSAFDDTELALLVFSAPVDSLEYDINSSSLSEADIQSLQIVTKKLSITIHHESENSPTETMLSFCQRVAEIGHFVELGIKLMLFDAPAEIVVPECVEVDRIRAALANANLQVLDLCDSELDDWEIYLETLLKCFENHKDLHTIKLSVVDEEQVFGPQFCFLRQLLSHYRNIALTKHDGTVYSDGDLVDKLYALNRFYRGSVSLLVEPPLERILLFTTALTEGAMNGFQRSALLLSDHTDVLCELVSLAQLITPI